MIGTVVITEGKKKNGRKIKENKWKKKKMEEDCQEQGEVQPFIGRYYIFFEMME